MKKNLLGLAFATALFAGASTAQAADMYDGSWYLLPGASYFNPDSDTDADNGAGGFLKLGKEISQHWDLQGGLSYNKSDEDFSGPFVLAGMGMAKNDLDYKLNGAQIGDDNTSWLANVGLGAQLLFTDTFGIQADLRHQWTEIDTAGRDDESVGNTLFNLGGIFRFEEMSMCLSR